MCLGGPTHVVQFGTEPAVHQLAASKRASALSTEAWSWVSIFGVVQRREMFNAGVCER